jgi:hypothetical protein
MRENSRRVVLGGAMHGQAVTILHGSKITHMPSGDTYKRYGNLWWVPEADDQAASEKRIVEWRNGQQRNGNRC